MLLTPAQIKRKSFESRLNTVFTRGGCVSCLRACLGARLLPQSYQYPNLSEGADRVCGQLRGDKECPFSDVTKSGRVWRKVPENGARSVGCSVYVWAHIDYCHSKRRTMFIAYNLYVVTGIAVVLLFLLLLLLLLFKKIYTRFTQGIIVYKGPTGKFMISGLRMCVFLFARIRPSWLR